MDPNTRNQLQLLSIFHYVLAAFGAVFSLIPVIYIVIGAAMVSGAFDGKDGAPPPPAAVGWVFAAVGILLMLMGLAYVILVVLAGRFLARTRHWTYCVVVAAISCAFFPFGTVLGVFTVLVLAKQEVKAAFEATNPG